ncbi:MAG: ABC transporter ATP-binding protein [Methylobacteriaceae bacterium]|nr:ABC transporter ATP-binding protein [Methylobacteriaceae bacterium]
MAQSQASSLASQDSQADPYIQPADQTRPSQRPPDKVVIEKLHKTYRTTSGRTVALQDVNLAIGKNEFIALVGPSGCGKSTLLRVISALIRPSRGRITIDGVSLTKPSNEIGIVFQQAVLLPWRSVLDNVLLPAEILRLDRDKARARARDLLNMVGLSGFEARYPGELSGGMQQRAAICRALIHNPTMLLMDEPFAALDAMTREELGLELLRIWAVEKKTIVFVTHNINEAILLSDRVVAMSPRPGRISEIVSVDLPRPRTLDMEFLPRFKSYSDRVRATIGHT